MSKDKAIHTLYEMLKTGDFMCVVPYGDNGRYATYYAEDRLYLVFDLWYHGLFLVEAKSPRDAIDQVNCDRLAYIPKWEEVLDQIGGIDLVTCAECKFKSLYDGETKYYYCALEDRPNRQWSVDDWNYCYWGERKE